jgi:RNA polymerase sigma-70 factor (ECF subfamily)
MNIPDNKQAVFDLLFNKYYTKLCVYSDTLVGGRQVSEDLVQDVFVSVWMKRNELDFNEKMGIYLYKAVHNACLQYLRRQKIEQKYSAHVQAKLAEAELIPFSQVTVDVDPAEANEITFLYHQTLDRLPVQTRKIFLLSREKGMKYSEIAVQTGLSVKSVEYHIGKALEIFRKSLKDYWWMWIGIFYIVP